MKMTLRVLSGLMLAALSAGAMAAGSAPAQQLDMTANLTAGACVLQQKDIQVDFGELSREDYLKLANQSLWHDEHVKFIFTGCPSSYSKVNVTPEFETHGGNGILLENTGTAGYAGFTLTLNSLHDSSQNRWANAQAKSFTLSDGGAEVSIWPALSKNTGYGQFAAGTINASAVFNFSFD